MAHDGAVYEFECRGAIKRLFESTDPEVIIAGPAGTGKTRGNLEYVHLILTAFPGARGVMCRKTRRSITESCFQVFKYEVLKPEDGVKWHTTDQKFYYPNGSELIVCGMDDPTKIMSAQYDIIYFCEATEADLRDWEYLNTRLRASKVPFQRLIGDVNPDDPSHFLKRREAEGRLVMWDSKFEDNASFYRDGQWTKRGADYLARLQRSLTGIRYERLFKGIWASAEGAVYEEWDRSLHLLDPIQQIPSDWVSYWSIDFGYKDPFVWQWWLVDTDNRMHLHKEIYFTERTVAEHAKDIMRAVTKPKGGGIYMPRAIITDHNSESRAVLEQVWGFLTLNAFKAIQPGIQAVKDRLRIMGDGRPGLFIHRDALIESDPKLTKDHYPICTEQEITSYVWDKRLRERGTSGKRNEVPLDRYNHGMDAMRYMVAYLDDLAIDPQGLQDGSMLPVDSDSMQDDQVMISPL